MLGPSLRQLLVWYQRYEQVEELGGGGLSRGGPRCLSEGVGAWTANSFCIQSNIGTPRLVFGVNVFQKAPLGLYFDKF